MTSRPFSPSLRSPLTYAGTLAVPGATLYYEVRGTGPLLFTIGSPMAAREFAGVAEALAADHTVVTYDPRGIGRSPVDDPEQDSTPDLRADDIAALIEHLGADVADVFGSSGGAVTALALAARHPGKVRTVVAHEPPLLELLPDAEQRRAETEDLIETFHRDGPEAAWVTFLTNAGFDMSDPSVGPPPRDSDVDPAQELADMTRFFDHELRDTTRYLPDVPALKGTRVVVGIGAESAGLLTVQTSSLLARQLGVEPVIFPGDHAGFLGAPVEFADALRAVL